MTFIAVFIYTFKHCCGIGSVKNLVEELEFSLLCTNKNIMDIESHHLFSLDSINETVT